MKKRWFFGILILTALIILSIGFFLTQKNSPVDNSNSTTQLANPASEYCVKQGAKLEIRDGTDGQIGYCISSDGQECEEWAFFRGECFFKNQQLCVADSCCHPAGCVLKNESLNCQNTMCTMECRGGTMDCGAGHCAFVDGNCEVVWNEE